MYQPAGNLTSTGTIAHLATVYYDRTALDNLKTKFMFWVGVDEKVLPKHQGKTVQWYRYTSFGSNTTAKTEGAVGTSLQLTTSTVSATVSQYADFISISDMLEATAIDPIVENAASELGYRAGKTVDDIIKAEVDSVASSIDLAPLGTYLQAADFANARHIMQGADVQPKKGNYFPSLAHPYVTYDLLNDPSASGFQDLVKHQANSQFDRNFTLEDRGFVARLHGCEIYESTNVTKISGTPNKWRVYIFGRGGLASLDLAGMGPSRVRDPKAQRFSLKVKRYNDSSVADPENVIRATVAYNFVFAAKVLDSTNYRMRKIDVESSIVA